MCHMVTVTVWVGVCVVCGMSVSARRSVRDVVGAYAWARSGRCAAGRPMWRCACGHREMILTCVCGYVMVCGCRAVLVVRSHTGVYCVCACVSRVHEERVVFRHCDRPY